MHDKNVKEQIKRENRVAADWLIYFRERLREHNERRLELAAGSRKTDENVGGSRASLPGRPVESTALKLVEFDAGDTAKWLQVVEDVKSIVGPKKRQLIELRQECSLYISPDGGRPGWIAPVQLRFGETAGWCPAEQTLYNMWSEIVALTVRIARMKECKF